MKKYKVKTDHYYKEEGSLFYTCVYCGVQHRSKHLMKKIHIPNCLEKPRRQKTKQYRLKGIITIQLMYEDIITKIKGKIT